jgi:hypothetical protein
VKLWTALIDRWYVTVNEPLTQRPSNGEGRMSSRRLGLLAAMAGAIVTLACASAADAATYFLHGVTFDDGATATGSFTTNVYDIVDGVSIVTTSTPAAAGYNYAAPWNVNQTANSVSFNDPPSYQGYFTLTTLNAINSSGVNPLLTGGASAECPLGCTAPRSVVSGYISTSAIAAAPEPAAWSLMLLGVGVVGFGLRRARKAGAAFA